MRNQKRNQFGILCMLTILASIIVLSTFPLYAAPPLKALIVDGQNNHDWKSTTPILKEILAESGLFSVDIDTSPAAGQPMSSFKPAFTAYNVVVLNYTGDDWPKETQTAFVDYVKNGGGVVVFHAANNAFPKWPEFNEIIGLGGWGDRNEQSGPMVRWRDGQMVFDNSPGPGGTHGPQHDYPVVIRDNEHPITKGLPDSWMHAKDELYARLRGPAKNLHILATSLSETTNEEEPMLFTIEYGKGRIFHDALGDNPFPMSDVGFAFTLQRGAEWAATGQVTLNQIPDNFPSATKVGLRLRSVSADALKKYKAGDSRETLSVVEENIPRAGSAQIQKIEHTLIEVLTAADATFDAKEFVCKTLRRMGSEACLPALEALLRDEKLSHMARYALQGLPSEKVNPILRKALSELSGNLRIGVIGTLAQRGDREAAEIVAPWLENSDALLAETSIKALGAIGGEKAAESLNKANVAEPLKALRDDALLRCADAFQAEGKIAEAKTLYAKFSDKQYSSIIRVAAYRGLIALDPENSVSELIALVKSEDESLRLAAIGPFLRMIPGSAMTEALAVELPSLPPETQILVLGALAQRGDSKAVPAFVAAAGGDNAEVKIAALQAMGILGDASCVSTLATAAAQGGEAGSAAEQSLNQLANVDEEILRALKTVGTKEQAVLVRCLTARRTKGAAPIFMELALDSDAEVRKEAVNSISVTATEEDIPAVLNLINKLEKAEDIQAIENAVLTIAKTMKDADRRTDLLASAAKDSSSNLRVAIIHLLGVFGGEKACGLVCEALKEGNVKEVQDAAMQSLVNWPDSSAMEILLSLAQNEADPTKRQEALKGYLRSIDLAMDDSIEKTVERYQTAMQTAQTVEEKQLGIQSVSKRTNPAILDFLEKYLADPDLGKEALTGYKEIVKQLEISSVDREKWAVSASNNSDNAKNAIDGKPGTRWDSGVSQKPGLWFQVDLGAECVVEEITLDATGSNGDYPRKYEVYFSFDGNNWGAPVVQGDGDGPLTKIAVPSKSGRYIKIVETGSVDGLYWSIHEFNMKASASKQQLERAYEVLKQFDK